MIKLGDLIYQALPLSVAKQYSKNWDKKRLASWFGNKNRVYVPLSGNVKIQQTSKIEKEIEKVLSSNQYQLEDYEKGLAKSKKYNRTQKVGKILQKIKPQLLQPFNNDPARQTTKQKPIVCISRHPYDIAGMSTDRGWTSCKDLGTNRIYSKGTQRLKPGIYSDLVKQQVNKLLIAYLIYPDDTNIQYPIARINIIPYVNIENPNDIKFDVSKMCYGQAGVNYNAFISTVTDWLFKKQGTLESPEDLIYKIDSDIYNDNNPQFLKKSGDEVWNGGTRTKSWFGGIWKDGIWMAKIWLDGTWHNGTWKKGIWKSGVWQNGIWEDGTWEDGRWTGGKWMNGVWYEGDFSGGNWYNGTWKNGTWGGATWHNGTWQDGIWYHGTWKSGVWQHGIWEDGTWEFGSHYQGTWQKGQWEDGRWFGGKWYNGIWHDGHFTGGEWFNGTWKNGSWLSATWHNGTWQDGIWYHGTWKGGTWKGGWIQDPDKQGNFEKSWKWKKVGNVKLVRSPINPKEYFAKKEKD